MGERPGWGPVDSGDEGWHVGMTLEAMEDATPVGNHRNRS